MKKIVILFFIFVIVSTMVFCQEYTTDPTKTKSSIKVDYPSKGDTVIADSSCWIRWTRTGLQQMSVQIWRVKPGRKWAIANAASNNGKFLWVVPHDLPVGSYKIKIKAGTLKDAGGIFTVKKPSFTLYEPFKEEKLKVGTVKKIKWHASNAEGIKVTICLEDLVKQSRFQLATKIPGNQKEWDWEVGKYKNNGKNIWFPNEPISNKRCRIIISKQPTDYSYIGSFANAGPYFFVDR